MKLRDVHALWKNSSSWQSMCIIEPIRNIAYSFKQQSRQMHVPTLTYSYELQPLKQCRPNRNRLCFPEMRKDRIRNYRPTIKTALNSGRILVGLESYHLIWFGCVIRLGGSESKMVNGNKVGLWQVKYERDVESCTYWWCEKVVESWGLPRLRGLTFITYL